MTGSQTEFTELETMIVAASCREIIDVSELLRSSALMDMLEYNGLINMHGRLENAVKEIGKVIKNEPQ